MLTHKVNSPKPSISLVKFIRLILKANFMPWAGLDSNSSYITSTLWVYYLCNSLVKHMIAHTVVYSAHFIRLLPKKCCCFTSKFIFHISYFQPTSTLHQYIVIILIAVAQNDVHVYLKAYVYLLCCVSTLIVSKARLRLMIG